MGPRRRKAVARSAASRQTSRMECDTFVSEQFEVESDKVKYTPEHILAEHEYQSTSVEQAPDGKVKVFPKVDAFEFQTERKVPKLGIMLVGLGGHRGQQERLDVANEGARDQGQLLWFAHAGVH